MGVLFCTYSLLIQKSKSGKDVNLALAKEPELHYHRHIVDQHERGAAQEASKGQLEFGDYHALTAKYQSWATDVLESPRSKPAHSRLASYMQGVPSSASTASSHDDIPPSLHACRPWLQAGSDRGVVRGRGL